jgi:hypothetical protein
VVTLQVGSTLTSCCRLSGTSRSTTNRSPSSDAGSNAVPDPSLTRVASMSSGTLATLLLV